MIREVIKSVTDTLDMNQWNVIWVDNKGNSHSEWFYYKSRARDFYKRLPYVNKRMERA
ncbi:hypothetical protein [Staphylococcus arlettae]|uniref:hypothetical protein n=1 Tax=Staphylococcus arlettae TaxID=29378 RepID=UPI001788D7EC|nr:hypothetical protein [Staphylococcus arlettae]